MSNLAYCENVAFVPSQLSVACSGRSQAATADWERG